MPKPMPPDPMKTRIPDNWTFHDKNVAETFDSHVREQLPWYDLATEATIHIARHFIPTHGLIYDIGCSTGNIGNALRPTLVHKAAKLVGIDNSAEMKAKYTGPGTCEIANAPDYDYQEFDVAILFLVLMFLTPVQRHALIDKLEQKLRPGGAIIIMDKVADYNGYLATVMHRLTMCSKLKQGAKPGEVMKKEQSLIGVQRPIHPDSEIPGNYCEFLRFGEFAGWVHTK